MIDLGYLIAILALSAIVVIQAVERHYAIEQEQREKSKLLAAFLAKSSQDYQDTLRVEKKEVVKDPTNPDEIPVSELDDKAFEKFIKQETA
jgi:hypothetical protein